MIRLNQVGYETSGVRILHNVSFQADEGEIVGIIGPNGAGKTTLLRILAGVLAPTSGEALVGGLVPSRARRLLGYLPENYSLYPEMTVRQYVDYACRFFVGDRGRRKPLVREALAHLGLEDVAGRTLRHLTAGFRQRTALAAALAHRPKVLFLDEPAKALDPGQIASLGRLLKHRAAHGTSVVLSTHILGQVQSLAGRVFVMNAGTFVAETSISDYAFESSGTFVVVVRGDARELLPKVTGIHGVLHADATLDGDITRFEVTPAGRSDPREEVSTLLAPSFPVIELVTESGSLERLYARAVSGEERKAQ